MTDQIQKIKEEYTENDDVDEETLETAIEIALQTDEPQSNEESSLRNPLKWWFSLSSNEKEETFGFVLFVTGVASVILMFVLLAVILVF